MKNKDNNVRFLTKLIAVFVLFLVAFSKMIENVRANNNHQKFGNKYDDLTTLLMYEELVKDINTNDVCTPKDLYDCDKRRSGDYPRDLCTEKHGSIESKINHCKTYIKRDQEQCVKEKIAKGESKYPMTMRDCYRESFEKNLPAKKEFIPFYPRLGSLGGSYGINDIEPKCGCVNPVKKQIHDKLQEFKEERVSDGRFKSQNSNILKP